MNRFPLRSALAPLVHVDGDWARCNACSQAFWGMGNVTAVVLAKAERHAHKAHGAQGGRPQRRAAAQAPEALVTDAGLQALAEAAYKAAQAGLLEYLNAGVFRAGYAVGGGTYVIKVAKRSDGVACNLAEAQTYATAPADKRQYLCPVVAVSPTGEWIMMRFATRVGKLGWQDCDRVEGALAGHIDDLHPGNVGMVDGRPVATDYAAGGARGRCRQGEPARW